MATLISIKKTADGKWGKEHNGAKLYVVSLYYSKGKSKYNIMGLTNQYHLNISLNATNSDEANEQMELLKKDTDFHDSVNCYDFSVEELTKDTDFACTSIDIVGAEIKNVSIRYVASPYSREETLTKERARVARLFSAKKWKEHDE